MKRRDFIAITLSLMATPGLASDRSTSPQTVVATWYRLILELVRHTATYSPPVASRAFAYIGVAAYEALATGNPALHSLAGQLAALKPVPQRVTGVHDEAIVLNAVLTATALDFFANTGPTGQRAMSKLAEQLAAKTTATVPDDVIARSKAHGTAIAAHIFKWSLNDGGHAIENMGFPENYTPGKSPQDWVPTSTIDLQQTPLLPSWGQNRTFAMPSGNSCPVPPPPPYSEDPSSAFFAAAQEVRDIVRDLTDQQKLIARFWSDDPMLSSTPPGHWIAITLAIAETDDLAVDSLVECLARLGIGMADAFIGCWDAKYTYNLVRPVTYIHRLIDPAWEPLLITPPFPEYPSGHSTQSGAAAAVLTAFFGDDFAFVDPSHEDDGYDARSYPNFWAAAEEAAISRLYGGIHYRFAVENGVEQGRCIGTYAAELRTRG